MEGMDRGEGAREGRERGGGRGSTANGRTNESRDRWIMDGLATEAEFGMNRRHITGSMRSGRLNRMQVCTLIYTNLESL